MTGYKCIIYNNSTQGASKKPSNWLAGKRYKTCLGDGPQADIGWTFELDDILMIGDFNDCEDEASSGTTRNSPTSYTSWTSELVLRINTYICGHFVKYM